MPYLDALLGAHLVRRALYPAGEPRMEAPNKTLAVLITCHNRKEKTLECLRGLSEQKGAPFREIQTYLVDDGSTDGTDAAVRRLYPQVKLLQGDGSLYWNGGMRMAMSAAVSDGFDFYLWLNDDTRLSLDALVRLSDTQESLSDERAIVVGSLHDPVTLELTYGGSKSTSRINPFKLKMLEPSEATQRCDVFNGNVVLIPSAAIEVLGNLSDRLKHRGGDYEFALRAKRAGIPAWIAPGYYGSCSRNPVANTWRDARLPARQRVQKLMSPTGAPIGERFYLLSRYGGPFWPYHFLSLYVRFLASILLSR